MRRGSAASRDEDLVSTEGKHPRSGSPSPSPRGEGKKGSSPSPSAGLVLLGEFGRAHGLHGEVRLKSFTADPLAIATYGALATEDGRSVSLTSVRPAAGTPAAGAPAAGAPDVLVARVEGVTTRTEAEGLNRVRLFASRERLGPTDEDEFLLADLVGLPVQNTLGQRIGTIVSVPNYGGGDLLEIAPEGGGPSALLPFIKTFVPLVDLAGKRVTLAPPEDFFDVKSPPPAETGRVDGADDVLGGATARPSRAKARVPSRKDTPG